MGEDGVKMGEDGWKYEGIEGENCVKVKVKSEK